MNTFSRHNMKGSKLSAGEVLEIRRLYKEPSWTQGRLSREFQVSIVQIGRIVRGESWQQLPVPEVLMSEGELKDSAARLIALQSGVGKLQDVAEKQIGEGKRMLDEISEEGQERLRGYL